jgi:histone H3/H4
MDAVEAGAWARWCPHRFDELPRPRTAAHHRRVATRSTTTTATVSKTSVGMMAQLTGQYMVRVVCAANDRCRQHKRTTVDTEDILHALK